MGMIPPSRSVPLFSSTSSCRINEKFLDDLAAMLHGYVGIPEDIPGTLLFTLLKIWFLINGSRQDHFDLHRIRDANVAFELGFYNSMSSKVHP